MQEPTSIEVDLAERLPSVCLKCGATDEILRRPETLNVVSPAARSLGMVGGILGATIASVMRNNKELLVPILVVIGVGLAGFVFYSQKTAHRVEAALPLCKGCDEQWSKAKAARPVFLGVFALSGILLLAGMGSEEKAIVIAGGALFFGVCIYAIVTKPATRFVTATSANGSRVTLAQLSVKAVAILRDGGPPRKKKKKKKSPEPAIETETESQPDE